MQGMDDVSPPKWHLAHTTWFFESFLLKEFLTDYQRFDHNFEYLFNSYYEQVGSFHPRSQRGLLSRPSLKAIKAYRAHVDHRIVDLLCHAPSLDPQCLDILEIGIHHEMQHQELILMDVKYNYFKNPLHPAYSLDSYQKSHDTPSYKWLGLGEGLYEIGTASPASFHYDNEAGLHKVYIESVALADRLVSNGEFLAFMEDGGYSQSKLWLSDGWQHIKASKQTHPLYWFKKDQQWYEFTLHGDQVLDRNAPVSHVSYYEADAFARWYGARLPTEFEWEALFKTLETSKVHRGSQASHPYFNNDESFGLPCPLWQWTSSAYAPYPRFQTRQGALGEYNGKFMCQQYVLRGGSFGTPLHHIRPTYRNFFPPNSQWMFSGIRLAKESP